MFIREGTVESNGLGLPVGEGKFRQNSGVGHGRFGHLNVVERRHSVKTRGQITPMKDGGVAEVQVVFVDHHVVGVYVPSTTPECRPRRVVDPWHAGRMAARGSGGLSQPDPHEGWLLEDWKHPH